MDDIKKDLLVKNRQRILKSIDISDTLLKLQKYLVFDLSDKQRLCDQTLHPTETEQCAALFDLVLNRGNRDFWGFLHAIKGKTSHIFDMLHDENLVDVNNCFVCRQNQEGMSCHNCSGRKIFVFLIGDLGRAMGTGTFKFRKSFYLPKPSFKTLFLKLLTKLQLQFICQIIKIG